MSTDVKFETDDASTGTTPADVGTKPKESIRERWGRRWRKLKRGVKALVFVVLLASVLWIFRDKIFVTVDSGEVLIVYYRFFGGTSHNSIGREGMHLLAPWDKAYVYTVRMQTLLTPMTVMSKNALEVNVDAQIRFHILPGAVPYLHRKYGPDYVTKIVVPQLTQAVQDFIGQFQPEDLYNTDSSAAKAQVFDRAKQLIGGILISVDDIALFNIKLPSKVQAAVQDKAAAEQQSLAHAYMVKKEEQEQLRLKINADALKSYIATVGEIPKSVLIYKGIEATLELSKSPNSKIIVMGSHDNLPLMLGNVPDLSGK